MKPDGPGQSAHLLSAMLPELAQLDIPYAVIGALAASFHGVVRLSLDSDALISVTRRPGLRIRHPILQRLVSTVLHRTLIGRLPDHFPD